MEKTLSPRAAIVGIAGPMLAASEAALFRRYPPAGVILFGRNIVSPPQLAALIAELRAVLPPAAVLMVDQEGGRVARLRAPHWPTHPPAATIGALFAHDRTAGLRAAWLQGALIGWQCRVAGFDVVAAPVLDLKLPGAHAVIGDRAFAADAEAVAALGREMVAGMGAAGVQPVGKHVPGHGRARADSHLELPVVEDTDLAADCYPFAANADLPWMMTAHVRYLALDPRHPATLSAAILQGLVRDRFRFRGILVSDDLAMKALFGSLPELAHAALAAGCDIVLACDGSAASNEVLLSSLPPLSATVAARMVEAAKAREQVLELDPVALAAERESLLA